MSQATTGEPETLPAVFPEVLTLAEAAEYLRVSESDVIDSVNQQWLPGRKIADQWRFHKQGLADWLLQGSSKERLLRHAGVMKDDPNMGEMLDKIYGERGRPMVEDQP